MSNDHDAGASGSGEDSWLGIDSGQLHTLGWDKSRPLPPVPGESLEWDCVEEGAVEVAVARDPDRPAAWISIEREDMVQPRHPDQDGDGDHER